MFNPFPFLWPTWKHQEAFKKPLDTLWTQVYWNFVTTTQEVWVKTYYILGRPLANLWIKPPSERSHIPPGEVRKIIIFKSTFNFWDMLVSKKVKRYHITYFHNKSHPPFMEKIQPNITLLLPLTSRLPGYPVLTGALDLLAPRIDLASDFDVQMSPLLAFEKPKQRYGIDG